MFEYSVLSLFVCERFPAPRARAFIIARRLGSSFPVPPRRAGPGWPKFALRHRGRRLRAKRRSTPGVPTAASRRPARARAQACRHTSKHRQNSGQQALQPKARNFGIYLLRRRAYQYRRPRVRNIRPGAPYLIGHAKSAQASETFYKALRGPYQVPFGAAVAPGACTLK